MVKRSPTLPRPLFRARNVRLIFPAVAFFAMAGTVAGIADPGPRSPIAATTENLSQRRKGAERQRSQNADARVQKSEVAEEWRIANGGTSSRRPHVARENDATKDESQSAETRRQELEVADSAPLDVQCSMLTVQCSASTTSPPIHPTTQLRNHSTTFASLASAIAHAQSLHPTEDHPVLIQLGPGTYDLRFTNYNLQFGEGGNSLPTTNFREAGGSPAPATVAVVAAIGDRGGTAAAGRTNVERQMSNVNSIVHRASCIWHLNLRHIYFAGAGYEFTRIVCDRIIVDPDAITGFRDLQLDAVVELGDSFLPVHNVQVREVEMRDGQLDGLWRDAAGAVHLSRLSAETGRRDELPRRHEDTKGDQSDGHVERGGPTSNVECRMSFLAAPDPDATNTFVLKSGDSMTGALSVPQLSVGFTGALFAVSGCAYPQANGLYRFGNALHMGVPVYQNDHGSVMYLWIPYFWLIAPSLTCNYYSAYAVSHYGYYMGNSVPPAAWRDGVTVSPVAQQLLPSARFHGARLEFVADGITKSDAATYGQVLAADAALHDAIDDVRTTSVTHTHFSAATNVLLDVSIRTINTLRDEQLATQALLRVYVDTQDAALSNAVVRMQRGFVFRGQTNELLRESAQEEPPQTLVPARYQSVRSAADGLLHVIEVYVGKNPAPPLLLIRAGENIFGDVVGTAPADGKPRDGWQRYVCVPPAPITVNQQYCFGADKGTFPALDVRMTRGYPRGRAYVKPVFPSPGGWDDNYDLAFRVRLQQTRETHSVCVDEHGIAISNAAFTIDGQDIDARYVNSTGDTMSGVLSVPSLEVTMPVHWHVGSATSRADIVLEHGAAELRANAGDLRLAAPGYSVRAMAPLALCSNQCGSAVIAAGSDRVFVTRPGLPAAAVVIVSAVGNVSGAPFTVIVPGHGFWIRLPTVQSLEAVLNYAILTW